MKKKKIITLKPETETYWRSFYWLTNTLERYFNETLDGEEKKEVEKNLDFIAQQVFGEEKATLREAHFMEADRMIRENVFKHLGLPVEERKTSKLFLLCSKYAAAAAIFLLLLGIKLINH
jgi:hypothetical protein